MNFQELYYQLSTLTPAQLQTEVCCFEETTLLSPSPSYFWAHELRFDENKTPSLVGASFEGESDQAGFSNEKSGKLKPKKKRCKKKAG